MVGLPDHSAALRQAGAGILAEDYDVRIHYFDVLAVQLQVEDEFPLRLHELP